MITVNREECLKCTLPVQVCCGTPKRCREKYKKYLEKKANTRVRGISKIDTPNVHKA